MKWMVAIGVNREKETKKIMEEISGSYHMAAICSITYGNYNNCYAGNTIILDYILSEVPI